ncbi:hypothetical protein BDZ45DRAFT_694016 [Acephala macrosclerotiorum]|nr:hypothetical protein BDZ45DRAFT_694016 [Acephala macrosclerotiorum]
MNVAPRPAKRRKHNPAEETNADSPSPVIFVSPGLKPDIRIKVYDKYEFHVHSVVLKLHSAYFRQFLSSPDKSDAPASSEFQYEYVSTTGEEDEEGWMVEPVGESTSAWHGEYTAAEDLNRVAFQKVLSAFYHRDYTIDSTDELRSMTTIADYYCCLPTLSATLKGALLGSPMFDLTKNKRHSRFLESSYELISTARKLRNAELFRECFVHVVGTWVDGPIPKESLDILKQEPELLCLISAAHIDLCRTLLEVNQDMFLLIMDLENCESLLKDEGPDDLRRPTRNAAYYRRLKMHVELDYSEYYPQLYKKLDILFKNNLRFDRSGLGAGEGPYQYFLCASIKDEDLPWETTELDF